ncbi:MAG: hypothetical protein IPN69_24640 [Acidobacteria bacterium]|nr:hypothetical protein [Acidobacteriota bacterium]
MISRFVVSLRLFAVVLVLAYTVAAQTVPAPKDVIGFTPGEDRKLASWDRIIEYFKRLDAASDRVRFEEIGKTTMGAPFVYATITDPKNFANLEKIKEINAKLADPRTFKSNDKAAADLIKQGKTIVLITCGVHSTEVGSTLSSMLIAERLARAEDAETRKILENTVILLVPSLNPDGVDIVKKWYDKTLGTAFEGTDPPELYHKYTGHDNNRDWYAFTQVETQLTVDKLHNVWHPQIVHDIHQQGSRGARMFLPPYLKPVEPNVPPQIIEGFTELGNFIANDLRKKGFEGITTDSTYDAWTPARAYSHYHGGVRILSETASARIATPIDVKFDDLRGDQGFDAKKESANFSPVWKGGKWGLPDITKYMTTGAHSLLRHASDNRAKWLTRFYSIGKGAVRPRKDGEVFAYVFDHKASRFEGFLESALERAEVEVTSVGEFTLDGKTYLSGTRVILMNQPYSAFVTAMIEPQKYPDLLDANGAPIPPYDVTAHNLALLTDSKLIRVNRPIKFPELRNGFGTGNGDGFGCSYVDYRQTYKSSQPVMDEGWTRWVIENNLSYHPMCSEFVSTNDAKIRAGNFKRVKSIVFPDQNPNQILNGYAKGAMPDELTGGIGKEGVANLRKFVEAGGTLVFLNRASDFAIEQFGLPVRDVTEGLSRKDFFIPGSILRTKIDRRHPIANGMPAESIAWFENSPAFEISESDDTNVEIIARYPEKKEDILLSGWALGAEKIAGKAALVSINIGKGKIVLFGFRPQYRGQSLATFPLFFNAIGQ